MIIREIRGAIAQNKFSEYKKEFENRYNKKEG